MPEYQYTYEVDLAGAGVGDRQEIVALLAAGERLELVREPDNAHDQNAVAVHARGEQIGYVPAFRAEMVADFMDHGKPVDAHVVEVQEYETDAGRMALGVRMFLGMGEKTAWEKEHEAEQAATRPGRAERLIAAGEAMQGAGKATTKAGANVMGFGCLIVILLILGLIAWAVAC